MCWVAKSHPAKISQENRGKSLDSSSLWGIRMINMIRKKPNQTKPFWESKVRWREWWEEGRVLAFELEMLQRLTFPFFLHISRAAIPMHSATRGTHFTEFLHAEVPVNPSLNHLVFTTSCGSPRWHQNLGFLHWILHRISIWWAFHGPKASNNPTLSHGGRLYEASPQ